jgi:CHASE3 domain sensor protein
MSQLRQLTIDNPQQLAALNDLQPVIDARLDKVRTTVSLAQQGRRQEALATVSSGLGLDLMTKSRLRSMPFVSESRRSSFKAKPKAQRFAYGC